MYVYMCLLISNTWYATRRRDLSESLLDKWVEDKGPETDSESKITYKTQKP